jgi:hypothetical protein
MPGDAEDWKLYRRQVLSDLQRISGNVEKLADSDTEIRVDIGRLKLCAAIWGGVAGIFAGIIGTIMVAIFLNAV